VLKLWKLKDSDYFSVKEVKPAVSFTLLARLCVIASMLAMLALNRGSVKQCQPSRRSNQQQGQCPGKGARCEVQQTWSQPCRRGSESRPEACASHRKASRV